jgi:hypothetical protein
MQTGGFQFSTPQRQSLATVQGPRFDFVSGASLVPDVGNLPDPGIDTWMRGQQQATENLLSGVTLGVKGVAEGISQRFEQEHEKELLKEKAKLEEEEDLNQFLQNVYLADLKSEDNTLKDTLTKLQIDKERREQTAANYYSPLPPEALPTGTTSLGDVGASLFPQDIPSGSKFGFGFTEKPGKAVEQFSYDNRQAGAPASAAPLAQSELPSPFVEVPIKGTNKVILMDRITGKRVGDPYDKSDSPLGAVKIPEGSEITSQTYKTPSGTVTVKPKGEGRPVTDTFVTRMAQYDELGASLQDIKTRMKDVTRGPLVGIFKEKNPYDVGAQRLNKLVESIVPGLARSVFGEVGVLTNEDVARYKSMVPNVRTESELAEGLMEQLEKKLKSSRSNYLNSAKDGGFDVSGYFKSAAVKTQLQDQINELDQRIVKVDPASKEYSELYKKLEGLIIQQAKQE